MCNSITSDNKADELIWILLTSWRILLKWTSSFLKQATSCSIEFLNVLSTTRSSVDELTGCVCRVICWRCLRWSLSDVLDGVLRLWRLSSDRGLSEPYWLSGELLVFCNLRLSKRVARAGSWDLKRNFKLENLRFRKSIIQQQTFEPFQTDFLIKINKLDSSQTHTGNTASNKNDKARFVSSPTTRNHLAWNS